MFEQINDDDDDDDDVLTPLVGRASRFETVHVLFLRTPLQQLNEQRQKWHPACKKSCCSNSPKFTVGNQGPDLQKKNLKIILR